LTSTFDTCVIYTIRVCDKHC